MTKFIAGFILALIFSMPAYAQTQKIVKTVLPTSAIYELIQDPNDTEKTFMLNRYTGESWFLLKTNKHFLWQGILPLSGPKNPNVPKGWKGPAYQIIISDNVVMHGNQVFNTYLVNTATGATWALIISGNEMSWGGSFMTPRSSRTR